MSIFRPDFYLDNVTGINKEFVDRYKVKGILLDADNTLSTHGNKSPASGIKQWIEKMRSHDVSLVIVSNNNRKRITPFAKLLNLDFVCNGAKPLTFGINKAIKMLGLKKENVIIVGDQIFTDIVAGKLAGVRSVLVNPILLEDGPFFKFKRRLEKKILKDRMPDN